MSLHIVWGAVLTPEGAQHIEKIEAENERLREALHGVRSHVRKGGEGWAIIEDALASERTRS